LAKQLGNGHRQLVRSVSGMQAKGLGIEVYCQRMLQIASQTWNLWFLEALCSAAVT
jgi:hypothetical protein